MNNSRLNDDSKLMTSQIDYSEMDVNKIREFIKLLQEHQVNCEEHGKFVEAEMAKQRIVQFKKIEEEKLITDTKRIHEQQKIQLEKEQREELQVFNEKWDQGFYELTSRFNSQEQNLNDQHEVDFSQKLEDFEKKYPQYPKPSNEILNLNKVLIQAVKIKDYTKAHQYQVMIDKLNNSDNGKFTEEKQRKLKFFVEKIKSKHDMELNAFNTRAQAAFSEFKKNRALEFDKLILKFKNKIKELDSVQKLEVSMFSKISKGVSRGPNSRINSIMRSASSVNNMNSNIANFDYKKNSVA